MSHQRGVLPPPDTGEVPQVSPPPPPPPSNQQRFLVTTHVTPSRGQVWERDGQQRVVDEVKFYEDRPDGSGHLWVLFFVPPGKYRGAAVLDVWNIWASRATLIDTRA